MAKLLLRCVDRRYETGSGRSQLKTICTEPGIEGWYTVTVAGGIRRLIRDPGSDESRDIIARLREVTKLATISEIVVVNHGDCAEYAAAGYVFDSEDAQAEQAIHSNHLCRAEALLKSEFPGLGISLYYMNFRTGKMEPV